METPKNPIISVEVTIKVAVEKVWELWTLPEHITKWCFASNDWHVPTAENDLRKRGKFLTRMESKDGNFGFDFTGVYEEVKLHERIVYIIDDGRKVKVRFFANSDETRVIEEFEAEDTNPLELQQGGWQAILNNFKLYSECCI